LNKKLFELGDWVVEKALSLRGKWSNRIARLIVVAGLALCSEPIWQPYLNALLEAKFAFGVPDTNSPILGLVLVFGALAYQYLSEKRDRNQLRFPEEAEYRHDLEMLESLRVKCDERRILFILDRLEATDAWFDRDVDAFLSWTRHFDDETKRFLSIQLNDASCQLSSKLEELAGFTGAHFFVYPDHEFSSGRGYQNCLYPDHNIDRSARAANEEGMRFYRARQEQLGQIISDARSELKEFIGTLKRYFKDDYSTSLHDTY